MQLNFDARTVEPNKTLEPLPADWYAVQIVGSEGKPTKDKTGGYLELTLEVVFGPFKGRKVFDRLNLENRNAQTVEIAKGTLSAICHAVGVIQMTNTEQLHGKPLLAKVALKAASGEYSASNDVKGYKPMEGAAPAGGGIGGNGAGVPTWAGGATQQAAAPVESSPSPTTQQPTGGFSFATAQQPQAANAPAAAGDTPNWAKPAQA